MGWKNWPYWARGGILSITGILLISIIIGFIVAIIYNNIPDLEKGFFLTFFIIFSSAILLLPSFLLGILGSSPGSFGLEGNFIVALLVSLFTWFIIGALIGFIIGKIKSSKRRK